MGTPSWWKLFSKRPHVILMEIQNWDCVKIFLFDSVFGARNHKSSSKNISTDITHAINRSKILIQLIYIEYLRILNEHRGSLKWPFRQEGVIAHAWKCQKWIQRKKIPLEWFYGLFGVRLCLDWLRSLFSIQKDSITGNSAPTKKNHCYIVKSMKFTL